MTASRIILAVYDLPSVASAPCRVCGGVARSPMNLRPASPCMSRATHVMELEVRSPLRQKGTNDAVVRI